jgi:hypothetical protein
VAVLAALVLLCGATVVALRTVPHQARLERWLEKQPGVTSTWVTAGPRPGASDWASTATVTLDHELTPASFSMFATAYETYTADHAWAVAWGLTVSHGEIALPVCFHPGANTTMADLLTLVVTDPDVVHVHVEREYLGAVVVESTDPVATTAHLAPVRGHLPNMRVIRPGETVGR